MNKVTALTAIFALTIISTLTSCNKDDEAQIENFIVGTWELDKYEQLDYKDGVLVSSSESVDQGQVRFNEDGTGDDIGGNFIGGQFEWSNTATEFTLMTGGGTTVYDIEEYSKTNFVFSDTDVNGNDKFVERWHMSK